MSKPAVLLLSMGGTIAMLDDAGQGAVPRLEAGQIVEAVPELQTLADVTARSFRRVPGASLRLGDIRELATEIRRELADGKYAGVVVTQGTDTIEETSFALDLLLDVAPPVVVTGAMRSASQPGSDGPANLLDAVSVAGDPAGRGLGTLVVLNGEVHAARFARKQHSFRPNAFISVIGPLGWVSERRPRLVLRPSRPVANAPSGAGGKTSRVAILATAFDDDGALIEATRSLGYDGLVLEAMGAGHVPGDQVELLERVAGGIPVVLCSRTGGPVLTTTYGFPGSERDLLGRGLINAGYLDGPKARILLRLLLDGGAGRESVATSFQAFVDEGT